MNRIEDEIRLKRVLKEFSSDFHNSFTPFELCDEMLDKLPMLNINQDILVMFNLEFIYTIKERINNLDKVWFITPCEIKAQVAEAIGVKKNHIFFYSYKDKEIEKIDNMPKFDVVIGNPPYHKGLHMKFLEIAFNNSKKYVVFIQPSIWLLSDEKYAKGLNIKNKIRDHIYEIELINGMSLFNVAIGVPLSIIVIDKNKKYKLIKLFDKINDVNIDLSSINDINIWGNYNIYNSLKNKILEYTKKDNLRNSNNRRNPNFKYFFSLSQSRGHIKTSINGGFESDFYSLFPKEYEKLGYGPNNNVPEKWLNQHQRNWYGFKSKKETINFINYLKGKFVMFCVSINKFNMAIQEKEAECIPWLDFTQEWTDEKLYKHFNLSKEEINFIEENIPDYY